MTGPNDSHEYIHIPPDYPFHSYDIEHFENEVSPTRARLPIPDLRFEQVYLKRIQDCIHVEPTGHEQPTVVDVEDTEFTTCTHAAPLINSSQQLVRVDWGQITYITFRDQVMMPLLQGILWGMVGTYYRPVMDYARGRFGGSAILAHPVEGQGVGWLRRSLKRLGFSGITVGPPNFWLSL